MPNPIKSREEILAKLGIDQLNEMQIKALEVIGARSEVLLLSPTGTGKTLAFLLPVIERLDPEVAGVQALVLAPSRELAIQIEQVIREMGSGFKANVVYGGRPVSKDKMDLYQPPAILVGTPGRVADHLRRGTFRAETIRTLVLDEFDKSLEIGFEEQMTGIVEALPGVRKKILTSATHGVEIPDFVGLRDPVTLDFLSEGRPRLQVRTIPSPGKDKLDILVSTLQRLEGQAGIVFCNFKDSIQRVSEHLHRHRIDHGCFYGGMEQVDRERALIKFRNGTHRLIIATDLAARGIDVPEIGFIIHYHLPLRGEEFTHRNGRTARMHSDGTAYVIHWEKEDLPDFIRELHPETETWALEGRPARQAPLPSPWKTIYISGGRRDKISKGDIAGLFFKQARLAKDQLGVIELQQDCAYVAVAASQAEKVAHQLDNSRLKNKKVRVYVL